MTDDFDEALRDSLHTEMLGWTPVGRLDVARTRVLHRIRFRRRLRVTATAGAVALALVVAVLAGPLTSAGSANRVAIGPVTTLGRLGGGPPGAGGSPVTATGPCQVGCGPPTTRGSTPTTTRTTTRRTLPREGGGPGPVVSQPTTTVTEPASVPATTTTIPVGTTTTTIPATTTTTVGPPPPPVTYTVTAADNGGTFDVNRGDGILVQLRDCPGGSWSNPVATDAAVLVRQAPPGFPPPTTAQASFNAASAGQAQITAHQHAPCAATPAAAFVITVVVWG